MHKSPIGPIASQISQSLPAGLIPSLNRPEKEAPSLISTLKTLGDDSNIQQHVESKLSDNPQLKAFHDGLISMVHDSFGSLENAVKPSNLEQFEAHVEALITKHPEAGDFLSSIGERAQDSLLRKLAAPSEQSSATLPFLRPTEEPIRAALIDLAAA